VPQYRTAGRLQSELAAEREKVRALNWNARIGASTRVAAAMLLETSRLNYGNASQLATEFFSQVRRLIGETNDSTVRQRLEQIAVKRDSVVAALARGDAGVQPQIQDVLQQMLELARSTSE
jgi:hypothetical protein